MLNPFPFVVTDSGDPADAPHGALPISLYGGGGAGGGGEVQDTGYQTLELPDLPGLSEGGNITIRRVGNQVFLQGILPWTEPITIEDITDGLWGLALISPVIPQGYIPDTPSHNSGYALFMEQLNSYNGKAGALAVPMRESFDEEGIFEERRVGIIPVGGLTTFQGIVYGISWFTADPFPSI